ncbi:MAG: hypothetical protein KOO60_06410 [Gemmatimonadales bacterium]|nr:hypothetical protein [Gemmatimonadales bacterium]
MAHRRNLATGRVMIGLLGGVTIGFLMAGAVFLSNSVTNLRADIAVLEGQKCCLEAQSAHLQKRWNLATAPRVIKDRALAEVGLVVPSEPALVMLRPSQPDHPLSRTWHNLLDGLGGGADAHAMSVSASSEAAGFVSLVPRAMAGQVR